LISLDLARAESPCPKMEHNPLEGTLQTPQK